MRLDTFFVGVIIVLAFLMGGILIIGDQSDNYNLDVDKDKYFTRTEQQIQNITKVTDEMKESTIREGKYTTADMFGWLLESGYRTMQLVWKMLGVPFDLVSDFYGLLNLPSNFPFSALFIAGMIVLIVFFFLYMYFRFQPR